MSYAKKGTIGTLLRVHVLLKYFCTLTFIRIGDGERFFSIYIKFRKSEKPHVVTNRFNNLNLKLIDSAVIDVYYVRSVQIFPRITLYNIYRTKMQCIMFCAYDQIFTRIKREKKLIVGVRVWHEIRENGEKLLCFLCVF